MSSNTLKKFENSELYSLYDFPCIPDSHGKLAFIEGNKSVPFEIKRVYYLFDVPYGAVRGGHAHIALNQILIPVAGSFDVILDNGLKRETIKLSCPNQGLYIAPYTWRELINFTSGSVCLVLASDHYDESDYIRDYETFLKSINK